MLMKLQLKRSTLSTGLLLLFIISILISAGFSQFFQAPIDSNTDINRFQSLFQPGQILSLKELKLKNSLGEFHFERADNKPESPWSILSPRSFPANGQLINGIIGSLEKIKIKAVHSLDAINISNYSLDAPSLELTLINNENESTLLKFGIVNPIDNSTFVSLSDQKAIYHIDNIKQSLGNLDLTDFVNTNLLKIQASQLQKMTIVRHLKDTKRNLMIEYEKNSWFGQSNKPLEVEKVVRYLETLSSLKSNTILDKVTGKQQKEINRYFEKPLYIITMSLRDGTVKRYEISPLVRQLSGIKVEKWQNVLFRDPHNKFVYVLNKEVLKYFNRSERNMHTLPIKKLFY
jgi:hypothetical protein